jgi:hypothetical protein
MTRRGGPQSNMSETSSPYTPQSEYRIHPREIRRAQERIPSWAKGSERPRLPPLHAHIWAAQQFQREDLRFVTPEPHRRESPLRYSPCEWANHRSFRLNMAELVKEQTPIPPAYEPVSATTSRAGQPGRVGTFWSSPARAPRTEGSQVATKPHPERAEAPRVNQCVVAIYSNCLA